MQTRPSPSWWSTSGLRLGGRLVLAVATFAAPRVLPTDIRIEPEADTWVDPNDPTSPHGSDPDLRVGGDGRSAYLRFRVAGVGAVSLSRVELKAMNAGGGGDIRTVTDSTWSESSLTWVNRPTPASTILDSLGMVQIGSTYAFDVSAAVTGDGVYSFAVTSANSDGSGYHSRESSDVHPALVVTTASPGPDGGTSSDGGTLPLPETLGIHPADPHHFAWRRSPLFFIGKSAFTLLARDDAYIQRYVDEAATQGFTQMRVWLMWKRDPASSAAAVPSDIWPFGGTPDAPDFGHLNGALLDKLERTLDVMAARGLVAEVTPFLCAMDYSRGFDAVLAGYVDEVARRLARHTNAYFEVANEYEHGCFGAGGLPATFVREAGRRFHAGAPWHLATVSSGASYLSIFASESWFGLANYHLTRDATWWLNPWNAFRTDWVRNKPLVSDEPTGSATQQEYDLWYRNYMGGLGRDTNPEHFRWSFFVAALSGGAVTFHSHKGITAELGSSPGVEFVRPFRDVMEGRVKHWRVEPAPGLVTSCGAGRCFAARADDQRLLYVLGGGGADVDIDLGPGDRRIAWIDPRTGAPLEERDSAGGVQRLTVAAGPDAFLLSNLRAPVEPPDAGSHEDGGSPENDAGSPPSDLDTNAKDGCVCSGVSGAAWVVVLLAGLVVLRRRSSA